jgi:crotonobetainyl-CoA:carnitine CoA-transferase CaiB-like acyl-CoA transferase
MLLADLGAEVVRVVDADDVTRTGRPGWLCWNRGKTLVADVEVDLDRLLVRADVLLTDARPSVMGAAGFEPESMRERAPALVHVWLAATGAHGRWSELPADHLLLDAIGEFAAHHPATSERPVASVVPLRHLLQGELAAVAALAGLHGRAHDGWGRTATVTGLNAEATAINTLIARSVDGPPVISSGKLLPGSPNFRLYQAGDGRWLFMAALSPELFFRALEVLDRLDVMAHEALAGEFVNVMRPEAVVLIGAELDATFATASAEEWIARFTAAGVPAALVGDPATWLTGPVVAHACPPVVREHADLGAVTMPGPPVDLAVDHPAAGPLPVLVSGADATRVWADVAPLARPVGPPPGATDRPLAGLRVIDMSTFLAGPFVGTLLAWHGAEVVKVEAPTGDPYSVFNAPYANVNEHKSRLALDLRDPEARDEFLELVAYADVVVDNLISPSLARLDLSPDRFEAANADLVRCSLTAYGTEGPYAELPGFDPIMQTLSGLVAVQGGAGRPVATAAPLHDVAAGAAGALGTLAALWVRRHAGYGQRVRTSLAAASTYIQSGDVTTYAGRPPRPMGGVDFAGPSSWHRYYEAADRCIAVAATTDAQRAALLVAVGRPDLAEVADDTRAEAIAAIVASRPWEEWVTALAAAGVPACHVVRRVELDDPFLVENDFTHVVDTPHVGRLEVPSGYGTWDHVERRPPLPVAALRADRAELLARWNRTKEKR